MQDAGKTDVPLNYRFHSEGKTKELYLKPGTRRVLVVSKSDITAGDGEKRKIITDKDEFANETTCNIFDLLERCGIATHFIGKFNATSFEAWLCNMVKAEVVIRRELPPGSSYLKRHPEVPEGTIFETPTVELFLKDDERHDPLIIPITGTSRCELFDAHKPLNNNKPISPLIKCPFTSNELPIVEETGRRVFLLLEAAFMIYGYKLQDLKIEFGRLPNTGRLVVADVIDVDSLRAVTPGGRKLSKQPFRDGDGPEVLETMYRIYKEGMTITKRFKKLSPKDLK